MKFYTPRQVADKLGISRHSLYDWLRKGYAKTAKRKGGCFGDYYIFIDQSELNRLEHIVRKKKSWPTKKPQVSQARRDRKKF